MKKFYAVSILLMASVTLLAQKTWNGGNGSWAVATNWSPNGVPAANATVTFNTGTAFTVTNVPNRTLNDITVTGNTDVTLQSAGAGGTITIANSTGDDLGVAVGSILRLGSNFNIA
ncbi:MAG: hypothetical protein EOO94_04470, partial [Pedobacter sp.]